MSGYQRQKQQHHLMKLPRGGGGETAASPSRRTAVEWVPLDKHPVFSSPAGSEIDPSTAACGWNLAAWDGLSSRFYVWDPSSSGIHRLSLRFSDDFSPTLLEAAYPSEFLVPGVEIKSAIYQIGLNIDGSALLLYGSQGAYAIFFRERISSDDNTLTYRTSLVGRQIYSSSSKGLNILQVCWHPYSSNHLGILSSDSVFRIFDLSSDFEQPEQEYYLQPVVAHGHHSAVSICPLAFSFGGHHLWDRFSVFFLFSDGSVYVICPVIPFGSLCSWKYIKGIYEDVRTFGLKSSNPKVLRNSNLAIAWLEATFPELADWSSLDSNILVSRAHPYTHLDASLVLQGPLCRIHAGDNDDSEFYKTNLDGRAVAFLYSSVGKDSIIVIAWKSGYLQVDALADEIQPAWNCGSHPRVRLDSQNGITGVAIICESSMQELPSRVLGQALSQEVHSGDGEDIAWLGCPPPLLRLAIVDLALPKEALTNSPLSLFADPIVLERFYCLHGGGIDVISLHFLPFAQPSLNTFKISKPPSVFPLLNTCHGGSFSPSICGFAAVADSSGQFQIVGITTSFECIVLEAVPWKEVHPYNLDLDVKATRQADSLFPEFISEELLSGPKPIALPVSVTSNSVTADSIGRRSTLHHYIKLFHENYVEYAHKVYVVLKQHKDHLKAIMEDQHKRLTEAKQILSTIEGKEHGINERINHTYLVHRNLEERLHNFKTLPGANKKPLSKAERDFKTQLERFADFELDALQCSVDALTARLRRYTQSSSIEKRTAGRIRKDVPRSQITQLKSSLDHLTNMNTEITEKLKLIEHELASKER